MYFFSSNNKEYLVIDSNIKLSLFMIKYNASGYLCVPTPLSDYFSLFYPDAKREDVSSLLPVMYKKGLLKKSK